MDSLPLMPGLQPSAYAPPQGAGYGLRYAEPAPLGVGNVQSAGRSGQGAGDEAGLSGSTRDSAEFRALAYGALRSRQDGLNAQAQAIRAGEAEPYMMRKLFPPYPPDQEARMALLDTMGGMRQQIEKLMPYEAFGSAPISGMTDMAMLDLSARSGHQLAEQFARPAAQARHESSEGISRNRPVLEVVAQIEPLQ